MKKIITIFLAITLVLTNFQGWDCLKEIEIFKRFDLFQGIGQSFAETGTLLEGSGIYYQISNGKVTITDADTSISGDLVIPETIKGYPVTTINGYAFHECKNLKSIEMPDSITTIGERAFWYCSSLTSIKISNNVKTLEYGVLSNCDKLENIKIPNSVTTIGKYAFNGCFNLSKVYLTDSVTTIKSNAFGYCSNLTIYGYSGSYAQTYAKNNNIPFVILKDKYLLEGKYLTEEEAKCFIGFLFNTNNLTEEELNKNDIFKLMTGKLSGIDEEYAAVQFLSFMNAQLNDTVGNLEGITDQSSQYLIEYLETKANGNLASEIINDTLHDISNQFLDFVKDEYLISGGEFEDKEYEFFENGMLSWDLIKKITYIPDKVEEYKKQILALSHTCFFVAGTNKIEMYKYFLYYKNNLEIKYSIGEEAFDLVNSANAVLNEKLALIKMIEPTLENWPFLDEHMLLWATEDRIALIERWAEYSYLLEKTIKETATSVENEETQYIEEGNVSVHYNVIEESDLEYQLTSEGAIIKKYNGCLSYAKIPNRIKGYSVIEISDNAFSNNPWLRYVYIPATVKTIGNNAFLNCTGLQKVIIPNGNVSIGQRAFGFYRKQTINDKEYLMDIGLGATLCGISNSNVEVYANESENLFEALDWDGKTKTEVFPVGDTYYINMVSELAWIASKTNSGTTFEGKKIIISGDFNFNSKNWTSIGTNKNPFKGSIEIKNATFNNLYYAGLFGEVSSKDVYISNVIFNNSKISASSYDVMQAGMLFGKLNLLDNGRMKIDNSVFSGSVSLKSGQNGGIIGNLNINSGATADFSQLKVKATIGGNASYIQNLISGGIVSYISGSGSINIYDCLVDGNISALCGDGVSGGYVSGKSGGLIGLSEGSNKICIKQCSVYGSIKSSGFADSALNTGGFIGNATYKTIQISDSLVQASLGGNWVGGFLGTSVCSDRSSSFIKNCYLSGACPTKGAAFISFNSSSTEVFPIENCYFDLNTTNLGRGQKVANYYGNNWVTKNVETSFGYNTSDMKKQESYISWNFNNIWCLENDSYPVLISQMEGKNHYKIDAQASVGGEISPSGITNIVEGSTIQYSIITHRGYQIEELIVDGEVIEPTNTYTFNNVNSNHTISVIFKEKDNVYDYKEVDGGICITKYDGKESDIDVVVPDEIDGKKVIEIGERAFENYDKLVSITLPTSLKYIDLYAFYGCKQLQTVKFNQLLEGIDSYAFLDCSNLKAVRLPNSLKYINDYVFSNTGLTSIEIPQSVEHITSYTFYDINRIKNIYVSKDNSTYYDIDGVLYQKDEKKLLYYPEGRLAQEFVVPEETQSVEGEAFNINSPYLTKYLIKIVFPQSVIKLNDSKSNLKFKDLIFLNKDTNIISESQDFSEYIIYSYGSGAIEESVGEKFKSLDISSISLAQDIININVCDNLKLDLNISPIDSNSHLEYIKEYNTFTWKSDNEDIVSVDQEGNITANNLGTANIEVSTDKGLTSSCLVTVHGIDSAETNLSIQGDENIIEMQESTIIANVVGGSGNYEYKFLEKDGNKWSIIQDYSSSNTAVYTPKSVGSKTLYVDIKDMQTGEKIRKYLVIKVEYPDLQIHNFIASPEEKQIIGQKIELSTQGIGGSGSYQYKFLEKDSEGNWTKIRDYEDINTATYIPTSVGKKTLYVDVKDTITGKIFRKSLIIEIEYPELQIDNFIASPEDKQIVGEEVELSAQGIGGSGNYQYKFLEKDSKGNWTKIRDYESENTATYIPTSVGKKTLYVDVKDTKTGQVMRKSLIYDVEYSDVEIESLVVSPEKYQVLGEEIELTANVIGGSGNFEYKFIEKDSQGNWIKIRDYEETNTTKYTPQSIGKTTLYVDVKDLDTKKVIRKYVIFVVCESKFEVTSFKADKESPYTVDDEITLTAKAIGGSEKYQYKFLVKEGNTWTKLQSYSDENTCNYVPKTEGSKTLYVDVKDTVTGVVIRKYLLVKVVE